MPSAPLPIVIGPLLLTVTLLPPLLMPAVEPAVPMVSVPTSW